MKLTIVVQDLVGQGVQYVAATTARMFASRGWDVDVLVSQVHFDLLAKGQNAFLLPPNAKVIRMPSRRGSRNGWFMRNYLTHSFFASYFLAAMRFLLGKSDCMMVWLPFANILFTPMVSVMSGYWIKRHRPRVFAICCGGRE